MAGGPVTGAHHDDISGPYRRRAARAALGAAGTGALDPGRDPAGCLEAMAEVYAWYGRLYLRHPRRLLWAGLARLAGARIVEGLTGAVRLGAAGGAERGPDPGVGAYGRMLVTTCRRIFDEVGWLHEAYLEDPAAAVDAARHADRHAPARPAGTFPLAAPLAFPVAPWAAIWAGVASGDDDEVAEANRRMLAREQLVAQAGYDALRDEVRAMSRYVPAVHPYHGDFPGNDIGDPEQRWAWVDEMWKTWSRLPVTERVRLVRGP